ncbi:hypothetical protein L9F63_000641, partial [Diploptera punctata]
GRFISGGCRWRVQGEGSNLLRVSAVDVEDVVLVEGAGGGCSGEGSNLLRVSAVDVEDVVLVEGAG